MVIHTADISGAAKEWNLEMKWAKLISQEFSEQAIAEEQLKVNITSLNKHLISKTYMMK